MIKIKILLSAILVSALIFVANSTASAQEPDLLYSESHSYSVIMRGNTETIAYDRITLTNNKSTAINQYSFEIPDLEVSAIAGFQIETQKYCTQYDYSKPNTGSSQRPCLVYDENEYSYGGNATYKKLSFTKSGNKYQVTLPNNIEPTKKSTIVLNYAGKGYVNKRLGLYDFNFETIKSANRIKEVTVSVDVDSDLVLEGGKAKVNYNDSKANVQSQLMSGASLDLSDTKNLSNVVSSIGSGGSITKSAKNLAANESFSVKGKYAESAWRLHVGKFLMIGLFLVAMIAGIYWLNRKFGGKNVPTKNKNTSSKLGSTIKSSPGNLASPLYIGVGLISSTTVVVATYVLTYTLNKTSSYNNPDPVSSIIVGIIIILFYLLAILGPAIWIAANKRDWKTLIYILFWVFAWLLVFAAIYQWGLKDIIDTTPDQKYPVYPDDCTLC